ncbi:MAG: helix-turn-helix domain-containing protein [Leucobacter sp.]|nr:helix-turn-helix domain-containing protein [Leucobacter sp.]
MSTPDAARAAHVAHDAHAAAPSVADVLARLPGSVRAALPEQASALASRPFDGVRLWREHLAPEALRDALLLVPGRIDAALLEELEQAIEAHEAAAILLPDDAAALIAERGGALASRALLVTPEVDWIDLAALLRSLGAAGLARETAGLRTGDLFALAQAFATLAGGAISIVDAAGRIVGYSTLPNQEIDEVRRQSTLTLREEASPRLDDEYRLLARSAAAQWFPGRGANFSRAALPVRAQGELLGSVWLIVTDDAGAAKALEFLDSVAGLAAHHMLEARESASAETQRDADLLRTLLTDETFRPIAFAELGMRAGTDYRAVAFIVLDDREANPVLDAWRQLHHISLTARSIFGWCRAAIIGDQVICMIPDAGDDVVESFAGRVLDATRLDTWAGIGSPGTDATGAAASLREAMAVVALLRTTGRVRMRVATLGAVRELLSLSRLLEHLDGVDVSEDDPAARLRTYDETFGTELTATLTAFLDNLGNVQRTASELHVHTNTVRYRLERIAQLGIDLDAPHVRLWLWLRLFAR